MKDNLLDIIGYTHSLGIIDLVKIVGTDTETEIHAIAEDKSYFNEPILKNKRVLSLNHLLNDYCFFNWILNMLNVCYILSGLVNCLINNLGLWLRSIHRLLTHQGIIYRVILSALNVIHLHL